MLIRSAPLVATAASFVMIVQARDQPALGVRLKAYAGNRDAVEEALEDRRELLVPDREHQHESLRAPKAVGIRRNPRPVGAVS